MIEILKVIVKNFENIVEVLENVLITLVKSGQEFSSSGIKTRQCEEYDVKSAC